ncbi:MAG: GAP family protein, partial [Actinobacteria bacterium]|nr:GAP family protein [Actinomycetota bacterium]
MLIQAAGLALLAALSPTALLIAAIYLGSARPRLVTAFYLAGAALMSLVMGVILLAVLRSANLQRPGEHTPRYGLRLGLGILLLAAAIVVARRTPRPPDPSKPPKGIVSRMVADPAPVSAFLVGLLVFAPGVSFLAAVQVIATAKAGFDLTVLALIIVVVINVLLVWLPIVVHLVAPGVATRYLTAFNGWLRAHGKLILICV